MGPVAGCSRSPELCPTGANARGLSVHPEARGGSQVGRKDKCVPGGQPEAPGGTVGLGHFAQEIRPSLWF